MAQSLAKLLSHLEKNDIFVPPFSHTNVVLKKVPDRDDTLDLATFCGTARLLGGGRNTGAKTENLGVAQQFCN